MTRSRRNHQEKVASESFLSNQNPKKETILFFLLLFFLPFQFGKHFWPEFAIVSGLRVDYLSPTLYISDIAIGLLMLLCCYQNVGQVLRLFPKIFIVVCLYLLLTVFLSDHVTNGVYHLVKFVEFAFVSFYTARFVTTPQRLQQVGVVLSLGVLVQSVLTIWQFVGQASVGGPFYFLGERTFTSQTPGIANASISGELLLRPYGTFSHPNVLAGFLLIVMIMCLFFWTRRGPVTPHPTHALIHFLLISSLLLGTSALILTMSRVALLIWFGILAVVFVGFLKVRAGKLLRLSLLVGGMILLFLFLAGPFGQRFLQSSMHEEAFIERQELVGSSVALFMNHPLRGVGLGNFLPALSLIQKPLSVGLYLQPVHNIFLLVLSETGLIGLGVFLAFLVRTYWYVFKQQHNYLAGVLLTVLLGLGLFDHYFLTLQQGQLLFAVILGLCWAKQAHD